MTIPINIMSDCEESYKSKIDYFSLRSRFAKPIRYRLHLTDQYSPAEDNHLENGLPSSEAELTAQVWKRFIEDTAWTYPTYTLMGGEPLLYPEVTDVLEFMGSTKASIEMVTNGYYLNDYIDLLNACDVKLIIGIEYPEENNEGWQKITDVLKTVKIESYKRINFNIVVSSKNSRNINHWLGTLAKYPIQSVSFQRSLDDLEGMSENTSPSMSEFVDFANGAQQSFSNSKTQIIFSTAFTNNQSMFDKNNVCLKPWLNPTILPNGDIANCKGQIIGNIKDDSIWKVWNGEENLKFRRVLLNNVKLSACHGCEDFYFRYNMYERDEVNG